MARIRTIKPEFWKHEDLSALPEATHLLAAALLNYADDFGYFNANPSLIRAECSPLREPSVSIPESLRSLQSVGYIDLGTGDNGRRYGRIAAFTTHQAVSHPTKSKISNKSIVWEVSGNSPEEFAKPPDPLRPEQGTGNREQGTGNTREAALPSEDVSHETKSPDPPGPVAIGLPEVEASPWLALIRIFDGIIVETFGPEMARPFPHAKDGTYAKRWWEQGLRGDQALLIFRARQGAKKQAGERPISSLKFFDEMVAETLLAPPPFLDRKKPLTFAPAVDEATKAAKTREMWENRAKQYCEFKHWMVGWGPNPGYGGCDLPTDLLERCLQADKDRKVRARAAQIAEDEAREKRA